MRKYGGFTLIELLIVIAILAILSVIGITNFQSARIKARDTGVKSDLQTIAKSLEAYVNDHHAYPLADSNGRIICQPTLNPNYCAWNTAFRDESGTIYAAKLPIDPSGSSYIYSSTGDSYTLYAHLENLNDASVITITPTVTCGTIDCNYKISSSNL